MNTSLASESYLSQARCGKNACVIAPLLLLLKSGLETYKTSSVTVGLDVENAVKDGVAKVLKEASIVIYVNKVLSVLGSEKHASNLRNSLSERVKGLRAVVGKDAEKEVMGEALHSKVQALLVWKAS